MATATKPTRYSIEFGNSLISNKFGPMKFKTPDDALVYMDKYNIDIEVANIVPVQTKILNTREDNDAHNVPTTVGRPKSPSQNAIEDAMHVRQTTRKTRRQDTLYCVVGMIMDEDGENVPKVVHVMANSRDMAKDKAEFKYDIVPLSVVEGRLKGALKEFVRQAITAVVYSDNDEE